ncbi:MAG: hypothetical protein RLZZ237_1962, partial [Pseudomonadota bacterium]
MGNTSQTSIDQRFKGKVALVTGGGS